MNNDKDILSAFLDDAASGRETSQLLDSHASNGDRLRRYQLIRASLRSELDPALFIDVSRQLRAAIEREPVPAARVHHAPTALKSMFTLPSWVRPVAGMAVAASVAVAVHREPYFGVR